MSSALLGLFSRKAPRALAPAMPAESRGSCFHCGLPMPVAPAFWVEFDGAMRPVCCGGCQAIVGVALAHGMGDYYRERDGHAVAA
jgi:Cu2+-exporting ATPase